MGRIKTQQIKRLTKKLMDNYGDEFGNEFGPNKKIVIGKLTGGSLKIRNIVAGYATRLKKKGYGKEDYVAPRAAPKPMGRDRDGDSSRGGSRGGSRGSSRDRN